jgi:hypothetical protein
MIMRRDPARVDEAFAWLRPRFPIQNPDVEVLLGHLENALSNLDRVTTREALNVLWQLTLGAHYLTGAVAPNANAKAVDLGTVSRLLAETDKFFETQTTGD